jgi:hypothetical protein
VGAHVEKDGKRLSEAVGRGRLVALRSEHAAKLEEGTALFDAVMSAARVFQGAVPVPQVVLQVALHLELPPQVVQSKAKSL